MVDVAWFLTSKDGAPGKDGQAEKDRGNWSKESDSLSATAVAGRKTVDIACDCPDGKASSQQHPHREDDHLGALRLCHAAIMDSR
jgi:hypothetical protein